MLTEKDDNKANSCESATECVPILWEGPVLFSYAPASAARGCEGWDCKALHLCNIITYVHMKLQLKLSFSLYFFLTF